MDRQRGDGLQSALQEYVVEPNKVILVGDTGVGKTHLLNKYVKGVLPRNPVPTIGVELATKTVSLKNGERVKAQIWDTGTLSLTQPARNSTVRLQWRT